MPEIAEVARLVHFLRLHLVGKKIAKVVAPDDANVFGKVGCSGPAFEKELKGRKVVEAGSQGKYFWLRLNDPGSHPVMHLGMTGWIHIQNDFTPYTNYEKRMSSEEKDAWPPRFWKFQLETEGKNPIKIAFTDSRRFGRIRLIDCPGDKIRQNSPLVENGPDPVVDKDIFTEQYLREIMRKRHVPVKALILNQAIISGVGNWVADESLYHARLHPEQYSNEFSDEEIKRLHESIRYVCQTAVDLLAESDKFPDSWLFAHRWGKGKGSGSLPSGEKLAWITVGGRTSCYCPALQKNTGHLVPGIKEEPVEDTDVQEKAKGSGARIKTKDDGDDTKPKSSRGRKLRAPENEDEGDAKPARKKVKTKVEAVKEAPKAVKPKASKPKSARTVEARDVPEPGRRRSGRLSNRV